MPRSRCFSSSLVATGFVFQYTSPDLSTAMVMFSGLV